MKSAPSLSRFSKIAPKNYFCYRLLKMSLAALTASAGFTMYSPVQAATSTWTGATSTDWGTAASWNSGAGPVPASADTALFNATGTITVANAIANQAVTNISFDTAAGNYTIGTTATKQLQLQSGGTTSILSSLTATNVTETINAPIVLAGANGAYTFSNNSANGTGAGAGKLVFGGTITGDTAGATVLTLSGSNTNANTITGIIGNGTATTLGVTKSGAGTWVLGGVNTYTGGTTVNGGILQLTQTAGAAATGTFNLGGGNFQINVGTSNFGYAPTINLTADSTFSSIGAGQINYTGTLTGNSHALTVTSGASRLYMNGTVSGITQFNVTSGAMGFDLSVGNRGGGAAVVVSSGASLYFANATNTLANDITLNGGTGQSGIGALVQEGTANATLSGTLTLNSTSSVGGTGTGNVTISGKITGAGGLTKIGNNSYLLTNSTNDYAGATTITAGGLQLGNGGTTGVLPTGSAITDNATFGINRSNAVVQGTDFSGAAITGSGAFIQSGTGTTTLNTANTFTGTTTMTAGTLSVADATYLGGATGNNNLIFNGGTLQITGTTMTSFGSHTPTFTATKAVGLDINNAANTFTVSQVLNQTTGGLTKSGAGTLVLTNANTYTGGTTISAGTLMIGNATALGGSAGNVSVTSGAVLDLNGTTMTNTNALTLNGTGISSGGALTNSSASAGTYAGLVTLGSTGVSMGGTGLINLTNVGTISGSGFNLTLQGAGGSISSIIGTGAGKLTVGAGTWTLSGANTFTGGTTLNGGTLVVGNATALGAASNAALAFGASSTGTLSLNGNSITLTDLTTNATVGTPVIQDNNATAATLTVNTTNTDTYAGVLKNGASGTLALTKTGAGTLTLSGANTYSGATTLTTGILKFAQTNAMSASSAVSVASGATLAVNVGGTGEFSGGSGNGTIGGLFAGLGGQSGSTISYTSGAAIGVDTTNAGSTVTQSTNLTGTGIGLTKLGTGTLALTGTNTYTGPTTISAGTLEYQAASAMSSSSALTIATGGTLSLKADANTTFTPGSLLGPGGAYTIAVNQLTGAGAGKTLTIGVGTFFGTGTSGSSLTVSSTSGDTLLISNQLALSNSIAASQQTITLSGANMTLNAGVNYNTDTNGPLLIVNANSNTLTINGNWTTGSNRWSGIQVNSGTVTMANGQNGGSSTNWGVYAVLNGGTLNLNSTSAIGGANAGNNFTINGGTLDNTSGSAKTSAANPNVTLGGNFAFSTSAGTSANNLSLGTGAVTNSGNRTITLNGAGALTFGGVMTNTLGAINTLTVNNGTGTTSTSAVSFGGYALSNSAISYTDVINGSGNVNITGAVTNGGTATASGLTYSGTGNLTLSGSSTYTGGTTVNSGTLTLGNATNTLADTGAVNVNGGTLALGTNTDTVGAVTLTSGAITGTGAGALTGTSYGVQSGSVSAKLGGSGIALNKTTSGTVTLSGINTYTGATTISGGTLAFSGSGTLASSSATTVSGSTILDISQSTSGVTMGDLSGSGTVNLGAAQLTVGNNTATSFTGTINDGGIGGGTGGSLTYNGLATFTLTGANTYTGATTINNGTLAVGATNTIGGSSSVVINGGTLALGAFNQTVAGVVLNSGSITGSTGVLSSATYDLKSGSVSAILGDYMGGPTDVDIDGGATVILSGANTYTGTTTIASGSIANYQNGTAFGTNGNINVTSGNTVQVQGGIAGGSGSTSMNLRGAGATGIGATGALENISGTNSYSGAVHLVTDSTIATDAGKLTLSGSVSGSGVLTKEGTGILALTGNNTYDSGTIINGGVLLANNATSSTGTYTVNVNSGGVLGGSGKIDTSDVTSGVAVDIASGGKLSPSNGVGTSTLTLALQTGTTVNLEAGSSLVFDLGAIGASDKVLVTGGMLSLSGQQFSDFTFNTQAGFGQGIYILMDSSSGIMGSLGTNLTGMVGGYSSTLTLVGNDLELQVGVVPEPGTYAMILGGLMVLVCLQRRKNKVD